MATKAVAVKWFQERKSTLSYLELEKTGIIFFFSKFFSEKNIFSCSFVPNEKSWNLKITSTGSGVWLSFSPPESNGKGLTFPFAVWHPSIKSLWMGQMTVFLPQGRVSPHSPTEKLSFPIQNLIIHRENLSFTYSGLTFPCECLQFPLCFKAGNFFYRNSWICKMGVGIPKQEQSFP